MPTKTSKPEQKAVPLKLYRSETDRMIGGVAGGIGEYFDIDPVVIRIIFIALAAFGGSGIPLYLILWIVIPTQSRIQLTTRETMRENVTEMKGRAQELADDVKSLSDRKTSRSWFGFLIVILGFIFLFDALGMVSFFTIRKFWPLLIIILGFIVLFKEDKK